MRKAPLAYGLAGFACASALVIAAPVRAQTIATLPSTCSTAQGPCVSAFPVVNPDGTTIGAAGGGGLIDTQLRATPVPVSGTVAVTSLATAGSTQQGAISNAAYTDVTGAASGTMISLLKGFFVQLAEINAKTPTLP